MNDLRLAWCTIKGAGLGLALAWITIGPPLVLLAVALFLLMEPAR